jgi:hypothetical protein
VESRRLPDIEPLDDHGYAMAVVYPDGNETVDDGRTYIGDDSN